MTEIEFINTGDVPRPASWAGNRKSEYNCLKVALGMLKFDSLPEDDSSQLQSSTAFVIRGLEDQRAVGRLRGACQSRMPREALRARFPEYHAVTRVSGQKQGDGTYSAYFYIALTRRRN